MSNQITYSSKFRMLLLALTSTVILSGCSHLQASTETAQIESEVAMNDEMVEPAKRTAIYKDAMKKQCFGDGVSLETMTKTLNTVGINVYCAERHKDGMVYPQVCGNDEGTVNVFSIAQSDLKTAKTLGFQELSNLTEATIKSDCFDHKSKRK